MFALYTDEPSSRRRTVTRTFRVDVEWDEVLQVEAEKLGITVSALMNQILRRYAVADRFFDRYRTIVIGNKTFNSILQSLSENQIAELGKAAGCIRPKERLLSVGRPLSFDSLCWLIGEIYDRYDYWFKSEHHVVKNENIFQLNHNLDKNWSIFVSNYMASMFKTILDVDVKTESRDDSVTVYVENRFVMPS